MKICYICNASKGINEFVKSQLDRKNSKCRSCQKDYYLNNRQKLSEYNKEYYKQNKKHLDEQHKNYYQVNKKHLLECQSVYLQTNESAKNNKKEYNKKYGKIYSKNYIKLRNINDPSFKLRQIVSRSIRAAMKRSNSQKIGSCLKYLPFSIQELKEHLEKQFEPWMNWNNRGRYNLLTWDNNDQSTWKWQIDHIIPQSNLPYSSMEDDNFKKCWSLENLRPLSAKQNNLDGTSRVRHQLINLTNKR